MTYQHANYRSGLTAIAAVLALSSTPLLGQDVTTPPDPVTETAPQPVSEPTASDPLAPETTASEPTEPAAESSTTAETPAPARTTRRAASRSRTVATDRAPAEPVRTAAAEPSPQAAQPVAEATPLPPAGAMNPEPMPVAEPAPAAVDEQLAASDLTTDESLPVAGAAALGLLALGGLGLAVQRRRRRRAELEHYQANKLYFDAHPAEPMPNGKEPAFARPIPQTAVVSAPAEMPAGVQRTKLPDGFDLSRFGPHVRAAYLGPTEDNPSLSLKNRLRRAAAMDQRARIEGESRPEQPKPANRPAPVLKPMWDEDGEGFMLRRARVGQTTRPAFHD